MYNNNANRQPAVWSRINNHFSVSDNACLKPDSEAYEGRAFYLTLDQAEHILNNIESFKKAVDVQRSRKLNKTLSKEKTKMIAQMIRMGLSAESATKAVDEILKKTAA